MSYRSFRLYLIALAIVLGSSVASSKEVKRESTEQAKNQNAATSQGEAQKPPIIVNVPPLPKKTDKEIEQETKERAEKAELDGKLVKLTGDLGYYTWELFSATAALVLATVALVVATVLLWRAALRQSRDARDFFTAAQRPWIAIEAKVASHIVWEENGARLYINVTLTNVGKSPAREVSFEADTFVLGRSNPDPIKTLKEYCENVTYRRSQPTASGTTIFPGKSSFCKFGLLIFREEILRNIKIQDSFAPMIMGSVTYRAAGISDLKYTGMLYNIVGRNPADPNLAMMLRISDGDLTPDKFGIGPYPGGDIAT